MLAQRMGALKREILTAYDARAAALSKLRRATRTQLARFTADRKALAMRQRAERTKGEAARSAGVRAWMRPITADRVAAHESWRALAVTMHGKRTSAPTASVKEPVAPAAPAVPTPTPPVAEVVKVAPERPGAPR